MGNYIDVCCNSEYFMNESAIEIGRKPNLQKDITNLYIDSSLRHQPSRKNPLNAGFQEVDGNSGAEYGLAAARTAVSSIE
jgi:hypothetical protein